LENLRVSDHLGGATVRRKIMDLREIGCAGYGLDSNGSVCVPMARVCKHVNDTSSSMKVQNFSSRLSTEFSNKTLCRVIN